MATENPGDKSTVEEIRQRFDADVDRFSNLETGQSATVDAPLAMSLIAEVAAAITPKATSVLDVGCGAGNYTLKLLGAAAKPERDPDRPEPPDARPGRGKDSGRHQRQASRPSRAISGRSTLAYNGTTSFSPLRCCTTCGTIPNGDPCLRSSSRACDRADRSGFST